MVRNTTKQAGFTLIELLVVVVIIGILASVAIPNFVGAQDKAKNSGVQANVHNMQSAVEQYAVDFSGAYPKTDDGLKTVIEGGYVPGYPKTPWNTQQASDKNIIRDSSGDKPLGTAGAIKYGAGTMDPPTAETNYGAVGYFMPASATAQDKYDMVGTGKKGNDAWCVIHVKNY